MSRFAVMTLATLLVTTSEAFVASSCSSVQHTSRGAVSYPKRPSTFNLMPTLRPAPRVETSVSMSMSDDAKKLIDVYSKFVWFVRPDLFLYDRLARVAWDNMNKAVKNIESDSPEKVLNKVFAEMQNDIAKIQEAYAESSEAQRRLTMKKQQAETAAGEWRGRARYALSQGYEQAARKALVQRQQFLETANKLQVDIDGQFEVTERLYQAMQALQTNFEQEIVKKEELISRAKTAQNVKKVNDMLKGAIKGNDSTANAFVSLEEKVEALEAAAELSSNMIGRNQAPTENEILELEFGLLEGQAAVDEEFKKLTKEMQGESALTSSSDSTSRARGMSDAEIEYELQKLRTSTMVERGEWTHAYDF